MSERSLLSRKTFFSQILLLFALVGVAFFLWNSFASTQAPFVSSEVQFTDASASGLQIVPASCPSSPHYAGECEGVPPSNPELCSLTISPSVISEGQSATISWQAMNTPPYSYQSGFINIGVGAVGPSGSTAITPGYAGGHDYAYSGTVNQASGPTYRFWCDAHIDVANCPAGTFMHDGQCVSSCPGGYSQQGNQCVRTECPAGYVQRGSECIASECPAGYVRQGNQCVFSSCPIGYVQQGSQCVFIECPAGYSRQGAQCVFTGCPAGYSQNGTSCSRRCSPTYFCAGNALYYRNESCVDSVERTCRSGWICNASSRQCVAPPPSIILWRVAPQLVRIEERTQVSWEARFVESCSVSGVSAGNTINTWAGISGSQQSASIPGQTLFTLSCRGEDGSTVATSTTVNIIPIFQET